MTYSREEKARIARTARRNVGGETTLILCAGFAALMVLFFILARFTFLPVASRTGLPSIIVWVCMSFGVAVIWAIVHFLKSRPIVEKARNLHASFLYEHLDEVRAQNEAKSKGLR